MDFWNRKKVEELKSKIRIAESREIELELKIEKLKAQIRGDRVCDGYCKNCKHSICTPNNDIFTGVICYTYQCALDCRCKDFERKE